MLTLLFPPYIGSLAGSSANPAAGTYRTLQLQIPPIQLSEPGVRNLKAALFFSSFFGRTFALGKFNYVNIICELKKVHY